MAAEALFGLDATQLNANLTPGETRSGPIDPRILTTGNRHASKFTQSEADKFVAQWEVVEHKSNTATGFSGTLSRHKDTKELVLVFRSTEFIDDAARDNEATNKLEIKELGWAFGQLNDMEAWYQSLRDRIDRPLTVVGYSLGGHLATAFNLMHGERFALSAGMQANAEIWLGDRTVLEYLLSPVRKAWHEAGRER